MCDELIKSDFDYLVHINFTISHGDLRRKKRKKKQVTN